MERFESRTELPEGAVEVVDEQLRDFRKMILGLKIKESEEGKKAHFTEVIPEDLTNDDQKMYEQIMGLVNLGSDYIEKISDEEFDNFKKTFELYRYKVQMSANSSRTNFSAYLSNMAFPIYANH